MVKTQNQVDVELVNYKIVNSDCQQGSRVFNTFDPTKSFGQLPDISPQNCIFLKTFSSELSYIEAWFTDQNSKPLELEDKINIILVINYSIKYKIDSLSNSTKR